VNCFSIPGIRGHDHVASCNRTCWISCWLVSAGRWRQRLTRDPIENCVMGKSADQQLITRYTYDTMHRHVVSFLNTKRP